MNKLIGALLFLLAFLPPVAAQAAPGGPDVWFYMVTDCPDWPDPNTCVLVGETIYFEVESGPRQGLAINVTCTQGATEVLNVTNPADPSSYVNNPFTMAWASGDAECIATLFETKKNGVVNVFSVMDFHAEGG